MTAEAVKTMTDNAVEVTLPLPDLTILRQGRRAPPKLPLELFGTALNDWLSNAAEGAGAPVDYVAGALLAGAAATIGNARRVAAWGSWVEPAGLWVANVGNPSSGKSPGADPVLHLLRAIEKDMATGFEEKQREWKTANEAATCARENWEKQVRKAVKDGATPPVMPAEAEAPPEVIRPRIVGNDTSTEKLALLLAAHNKGLLFHRDELSGWLGGFDRYTGSGADRAFWTEAYGGRSYTIDRVKHPLPIHIPYLLVGIMGGIQPDKLVELLHGADDGLTARFLWLWPDPIPPFRPQRCADPAPVLAALQRLAALALEDDAGDSVPRPRVVPLSKDASELFQSWRVEHYAAEQNVTGLLASSYGKAPGHALRLALVLEYLWWAIVPDAPEPTAISKKAIAAAAHLVENYFKPMAECVFGDASVPEDDRVAATLAQWVVKTKPSVINLRAVRRKARLPGLRKAEKVKLAAEVLVDAAWLFPPTFPAGAGRPREDYTVNPKLWEALP